MVAIQMFVSPHQLENVNHALGGTVCKAMSSLGATLSVVPVRARSPRDYAELREARRLIGWLKYPDPTEPVRHDELAWALTRLAGASFADGHPEWAGLFAKAAEMLDIDARASHPIPADMARRIDNELRLLAAFPVPATAVA